MKTCPVCQATAFDDMPICYGCMHRFSSELSKEQVSDESSISSENSSNIWYVRVELKNPDGSGQLWSMELSPDKAILSA